MSETEKTTDSKEPERDAAPAVAESPQPSHEKKPQETPAAVDPYWWAPWAVLIGLVLYGLLGFLGVLAPSHKGPTAADVPPPPAPSDQRLVPPK